MLKVKSKKKTELSCKKNKTQLFRKLLKLYRIFFQRNLYTVFHENI